MDSRLDLCIVRNTQHHGKDWQLKEEERSGGMPFARDASFEMNIQVEEDYFKVAANGRHEFDYRHRIPYNEITRFGIDGQFIDIHFVTYIKIKT
jgi:hypothetical protein